MGTPQHRWCWFGGGELNTSYNCLDRHVKAGRGDQTALIFHSAMEGKQETISYSELTDKVATMAGVLADSGVKKGDGQGTLFIAIAYLVAICWGCLS